MRIDDEIEVMNLDESHEKDRIHEFGREFMRKIEFMNLEENP